MEKVSAIDGLDLNILKVLMQNARADFKSIAKAVGVSDRTVARRIARLEQLGVIRGYYVDIEPRLQLGSGIRLHDYYITMTRTEWEELWNALHKVLGTGISILLFHAGKAVGSDLGSNLLKTYSNPIDALQALPRILENRGCQGCFFEKLDLNNHTGMFVVAKQRFEDPKGVFYEWVRGILTAVLETLLSRSVEVKVETDRAGRRAFIFKCAGEPSTWIGV